MPSANRLPSAKQTLTAFSKLRIKLLFQLSRRYDVFIKGCLQSIQLGLFVLQCRHCYWWLWYCSTCPVTCRRIANHDASVYVLRPFVVILFSSTTLRLLRSGALRLLGVVGWLKCVLVELSTDLKPVLSSLNCNFDF
jgi:hypothetical protein